jgi:hypothetical protein
MIRLSCRGYSHGGFGGNLEIGDDKIADVVTKTLETMPSHATHWSTRSMAKASGLSSFDGASNLERILSAASSQRDLQAIDRSAVR